MQKISLVALTLCFALNVYSQKIGFLMDDFHAERWEQDSSVISSVVEDLGEEVLVRVCNSDVGLQISQGEMLIDSGVTVLIIVASDGYKLKPLIDYAKAKGVKTIAYDRLIYDADIDYYVSFDNVRIGELQAEYIIKIKPHGKYVLINGPTFDPNANMFLKGQMNVLEKHITSGNISVVFNEQMHEWTSMEAFMVTSNFLAKYHDSVDAVIVANDGMAEGVIDALDLNGYNSVLVTGQDAEVKACKRILENKQVITIYKPIDELATEVAKLAVQLVNKEKITAEFSEIDNKFKKVLYLKLSPTLVHKENMKKVLIESGVMSEKDLSD